MPRVTPRSSVSINPRPEGGGLAVSRRISTADTNTAVVKASAGQLYGWYLTNVGATPVYLKIYDKATAPTLASDTPVLTLLIPGDSAGAGANAEFTNGITFENGISIAITGAVADNDETAIAADEVVTNLLYL